MNWENNSKYTQESKLFFIQWLKKLQFKMGQIESQSSHAIQFYTI